MTPLLFTTPSAFAAQLATGEAVRFGALIKSATSGQILAHVQETGVLQNVLSSLDVGSFSPLGVLDLAAEGYNAVKLEQLTRMTQSLMTMGMAGIGIGVVGIGVSVASAVITHRKLTQIQNDVAALDASVTAHFAALEMREHERLFADAKTALEHAQLLASTGEQQASQWLGLSYQLRAVANIAGTVLERMLRHPRLDLRHLERMVLAYLLCKNALIQALMRANQVPGALQEVRNLNADCQLHFERLNPANLLNRQAPADPTEWQPSLIRQRTQDTKHFLSSLRLHMDMAHHQRLLLTTLETRNISGSHYLESVAQERSAPLLLLKL